MEGADGADGAPPEGLAEGPEGGLARDRFLGLWATLAAAALALAASFGVNIYQAISIDGFSIAEIFATLVQGVGVALLGSGVLSSVGPGQASLLLSSWGIPPRLHGRSLCGFSFILLLLVAMIHGSLDDHYFRQGAALYEQGELAEAATAYLKGLELNPRAVGRRDELGEVYESLSEFDEAIKNYHAGAEGGDPRSLNNLGRVTLQATPTLAEAYLLLGLQRAEAQEQPDADLLYQLHRNLGWAFLRQQRAPVAEPWLREAIALDQGIEQIREGGGMAYCFLAQSLDLRGEPAEARPLWQSCLAQARPEFLHEFRWFLEVGREDLAYCLNTSKVVGGFEGQRRRDPAVRCDGLF